jgi:hypothetical protein
LGISGFVAHQSVRFQHLFSRHESWAHPLLGTCVSACRPLSNRGRPFLRRCSLASEPTGEMQGRKSRPCKSRRWRNSTLVSVYPDACWKVHFPALFFLPPPQRLVSVYACWKVHFFEEASFCIYIQVHSTQSRRTWYSMRPMSA